MKTQNIIQPIRNHLQPLALAVCAVMGLALAPAAQAGGTITVGDPLIPPGLVVGDTFRLAFITSTTRNGTSANIDDYNTFVTTLANGTGSLVKDRGWVWKAMASTTTVDARDNLGLGSITGYPLYRLDMFKLADSYTDFLTHFPPFHQQPNGDGSLFVDEKGIAHGDQQVMSGTATYFTSTPASNWVKYDDDAGGGPLGSLSGKTQTGKSKGEGGNWSTDGGQALSSSKYFYAMSEPLEIVAGGASDPYDTWAGPSGYNLTGLDAAKDADPDKDGQNNLMEFATNGDPTSGASGPRCYPLMYVIGADNALTYTIAVRKSATFAAAASPNESKQTATKDGVVYLVEGTKDLTTWNVVTVTEVTGTDANNVKTALGAKLTSPALGSDWEWHTFRTAGGTPTNTNDFVRLKVDVAP